MAPKASASTSCGGVEEMPRCVRRRRRQREDDSRDQPRHHADAEEDDRRDQVDEGGQRLHQVEHRPHRIELRAVRRGDADRHADRHADDRRGDDQRGVSVVSSQ